MPTQITQVEDEMRGITIFRIANKRIVEEWGESDMLGLLQQVGAIPAPGGHG